MCQGEHLGLRLEEDVEGCEALGSVPSAAVGEKRRFVFRAGNVGLLVECLPRKH